MRIPLKNSNESLKMISHLIITQICNTPPKYTSVEVQGFSKLDVLERISGKKFSEHSLITINAVQICVRNSKTGMPVRVMSKQNGLAFMAHGNQALLARDGEPQSAGSVDPDGKSVDAGGPPTPQPQYRPGVKRGRHKWGEEFDYWLGAPKMPVEKYREWMKSPTIQPWRARKCEKCKAMKMESPTKDINGFRQTLYMEFPTPHTIIKPTKYVRYAPECVPELTERAMTWFEKFCEDNLRIPNNTEYENAIF